MQQGDILTDNEAAYITALEEFWDLTADIIEGGRLTEADIPDDYQALILAMETLEQLRDGVENE